MSTKERIIFSICFALFTLSACTTAVADTDISTEGAATSEVTSSSKNVVQVDNSALSDAYMGDGTIDLTTKTGDELFANVYWVASNAIPYKGRRISYNGYIKNDEYPVLDEYYHSVVVSTDIYKEFDNTDEPSYAGFEYKLDSGEYLEDGVFVNITGDISYYELTGEDGNAMYYAILENVEIKQLEEN